MPEEQTTEPDRAPSPEVSKAKCSFSDSMPVACYVPGVGID